MMITIIKNNIGDLQLTNLNLVRIFNSEILSSQHIFFISLDFFHGKGNADGYFVAHFVKRIIEFCCSKSCCDVTVFAIHVSKDYAQQTIAFFF